MNKITKLAKSYRSQLLAALVAAAALILLIGLAQCGAGNNTAAGTKGVDSATQTSNNELSTSAAEQASATTSASSTASEDSSDRQVNESAPGTAPANDSAADAPGMPATSTADIHKPNSDGESSAAPSNNSDSTQEKHWVEDTKRVWVVDSEAWTERVPIYDSREFSICNVCGADITGHTAEHGKAHMLAGDGSGHHSEVRQVLVGYDKIEHAEQGHYETVVTGGHWE